MNTQMSPVATPPADELARVTLVFTGELARVTRVFEDAPPRVTRLPDNVALAPRRSRDPLRKLIAALGDPYHPRYVEAAAALVAIGPAALGELMMALSPARPWLTAYRAAEALAAIGDGAATGALLFAATHVRAMRAELRRDVVPRTWVASVATTGVPDVLPAGGKCPMSPPVRPGAHTAAPAREIAGQVRVPVLPVRNRPRLDKNQIGLVQAGDALIILEQRGNWYRVRLGDTKGAMSRINGEEGWIARFVVGAPSAQASIRP